MVKKRHEPVHGLSERKATREYMRTLKDVYKHEGLASAALYEIKSTLYSLGKRLSTFVEDLSVLAKTSPRSKPFSFRQEREYGGMMDQWIDERKELKAERHGYIIRGRKKKDNLENTAATTAIIAFLGSIFFMSPNVTGNAVANLSPASTNVTGVILFLLGIIGAFFCFRRR